MLNWWEIVFITVALLLVGQEKAQEKADQFYGLALKL